MCHATTQVMLWDWRQQTQIAALMGHQAPVLSVDMSVNGEVMASGDKVIHQLLFLCA